MLTTAKSPDWSLTQSFYLVMGGLVIKEEHAIYSLDPKTFLDLIDQSILHWPEVSEPEILDHSKSDWLVKILALIQIGYFVAQAIGRRLQDLPITPLELYTLGTILCAVTTYIAWWSKPFDVRRPTTCYPELPVPESLEYHSRLSLTNIPSENGWTFPIVMLIPSAFAGIHTIAKDFPFPTRVERYWWIHTNFGCMFSILVMCIWRFLAYQTRWVHLTWARIVTIIICVVYMVLKLGVMVEMFVCMRAVPVTVYQTPHWSQYFPSFG